MRKVAKANIAYTLTYQPWPIVLDWAKRVNTSWESHNVADLCTDAAGNLTNSGTLVAKMLLTCAQTQTRLTVAWDRPVLSPLATYPR
ncbi:hypothetical protein DPMN_031052 [Dreissena polymorpha]|uniref:Uncharacterized protein n=1 Tax=Dreissena polymorpha TaxID=45954 RepID=A0A9D4RIX2_DREPO|nr:hypothetical protein DPMN_031052 [Dreissena polymorpha]